MARTKLVNGERLPLTQNEEATRDAEESLAASKKASGAYVLSRSQFAWMLATSGLDDVFSKAKPLAKAANLAAYADTVLALETDTYRFDDIMGIVGKMANFIPRGSDVSEATIGAAWLLAKDK